VDVPSGKSVRLFLHWCEPKGADTTTDLDLSVGFYGDAWDHVGVCSYYHLVFGTSDTVIARSSGDLQDAPFPDGASEFVDVDLEAARKAGIRYAVAVVNAYAGLPFARLERAFAGLMLRDDVRGDIFDPRTVELAFALQGAHGVFMPMVLDIAERRLHWIDAYAPGAFHFNNVANSNRAITKVCPDLIAYFGSGTRMSMRELALLHAAARCDRVILRGAQIRALERAAGEGHAAFLGRLRSETGATVGDARSLLGEGPVLAALFRGDVELPSGSTCYVLFRDGVTGSIAAADLLA
jgi:hypothetical protein